MWYCTLELMTTFSKSAAEASYASTALLEKERGGSANTFWGLRILLVINPIKCLARARASQTDLINSSPGYREHQRHLIRDAAIFAFCNSLWEMLTMGNVSLLYASALSVFRGTAQPCLNNLPSL